MYVRLVKYKSYRMLSDGISFQRYGVDDSQLVYEVDDKIGIRLLKMVDDGGMPVFVEVRPEMLEPSQDATKQPIKYNVIPSKKVEEEKDEYPHFSTSTITDEEVPSTKSTEVRIKGGNVTSVPNANKVVV